MFPRVCFPILFIYRSTFGTYITVPLPCWNVTSTSWDPLFLQNRYPNASLAFTGTVDTAPPPPPPPSLPCISCGRFLPRFSAPSHFSSASSQSVSDPYTSLLRIKPSESGSRSLICQLAPSASESILIFGAAISATSAKILRWSQSSKQPTEALYRSLQRCSQIILRLSA